MPRGIAIHIGMNSVDPNHYQGWDGKLNACELDANDMAQISTSQGYATNMLLTKAATRQAVIDAIASAGQALGDGDILLVTYSGHGGQTYDVSGDEDDFQDETWCLYDGQLLDDELYDLWAKMPGGLRVLVISDSCHSGSVTKAALNERVGSQNGTPRFMPVEVAMRTYAANKAFYDSLAPMDNTDEIDATVRLISGCQDNQVSLEMPFNGKFTAALKRIWNNGAFSGDYALFHRRIQELLPPTQSPNHFVFGRFSPDYDQQPPFSIESNPALRRMKPSPFQPAGSAGTGIIRISKEEIGQEAMAAENPQEVFAKYFNTTGGFGQQLVLKPGYAWKYSGEVEKGFGTLLNWTNGICHWYRMAKFHQTREEHPDWKVIVSEGDSWFLHPLITDTINHLSEKYATYSLGGAGDEISDMVLQKQILPAIQTVDPQAVLLSGGGNDLLGEKILPNILKHYYEGATAEGLIDDSFYPALDKVINCYEVILGWIENAKPGLPVLLHAYDYAIPRPGGKYLGTHLEDKGIRDGALQGEILKVLLNRLHSRLLELQQTHGQVTVVTQYGTVGRDEWDDEIHPTSSGFKKVADRFAAVLDTIGD